jgi:hypothetical protein
MKKSFFDVYLARQLKKPKVKRAFQKESRVLSTGAGLAKAGEAPKPS